MEGLQFSSFVTTKVLFQTQKQYLCYILITFVSPYQAVMFQLNIVNNTCADVIKSFCMTLDIFVDLSN